MNKYEAIDEAEDLLQDIADIVTDESLPITIRVNALEILCEYGELLDAETGKK